MNWLKRRINFYYIKLSIFLALFTMTYYYLCKTTGEIKVWDEKYLSHELINLISFRFLINSNVCEECKSGFLLVILIQSAIPNIDRRKAIRETWGKQSECLKILFIMGASNVMNETSAIAKEDEQYHDIIQGNFLDAFRNLTYKHVMALKWATNYCPNAKYIVKTDDDLVVNAEVLYDTLKKGNWGDKKIIAGIMNYHTPVLRSGKWGTTKEEYPDDFYPDYCVGPFIIYSADVASRLLEESYKVPYFWIDDVHITGTLARRIGFQNYTNLDGTQWFLPSANDLYEKGSKDMKPFFFGPLHQETKDIYKMWKALK